MNIPKFVPADLDARIAHYNGTTPKGPAGGKRQLPIRESQIEAYLVKRVKALGGEVRKVKWIGRSGAPDRIVMLPIGETVIQQANGRIHIRSGGAIWIELKAPGKTPEPHQVREHERMRKMGQRVEVVDSFARVDEVLS